MKKTSQAFAYYNEHDPFAAEWLRQLISAGHIAPGVVDERSIEDVVPNELTGFTQCHFFAGIGGWSLALRLSGWPDDKPVWTGSCPCQPFSAAGKGAGFADERHLWPAFYHLIKECGPVIVFGEQVASKGTNPWFDLVQADLEQVGYAFGCVPFAAAGIGAPHIRERAYWVADSNGDGFQKRKRHGTVSQWQGETQQRKVFTVGGASFGRLADNDQHGCNQGRHGIATSGNDGIIGNDTACRLADNQINGRREQHQDVAGRGERGKKKMLEQRPWGSCVQYDPGPSGPTNGQWRDADWLFCRDGKWRPVEPSTFPLAPGVSNRVGLLRGYGNAIVPAQAAEFICAVMTDSN